MQLRQVLLRHFEVAHLVQVQRHHQGHLVTPAGILRVGDTTLRLTKVLVENALRHFLLDRDDLLLFGLLLFILVGHFGHFIDPIEIGNRLDRYQHHLIHKDMRADRDIDSTEITFIHLPSFQQRRDAFVTLAVVDDIVVFVDDVRDVDTCSHGRLIADARVGRPQRSDVNAILFRNVIKGFTILHDACLAIEEGCLFGLGLRLHHLGSLYHWFRLGLHDNRLWLSHNGFRFRLNYNRLGLHNDRFRLGLLHLRLRLGFYHNRLRFCLGLLSLWLRLRAHGNTQHMACLQAFFHLGIQRFDFFNRHVVYL